MCDTCGCAEKKHHEHHHDHQHGPDHSHVHDQQHDLPQDHTHNQDQAITIKLEKDILSRNDDQALHNAEFFAANGIVAINIISSPGSGKTFLLEKTLDVLNNRIKCGVITGDLQTDNDARRLMGKGAYIRQIQTGSACHLDAAQISAFLNEISENSVRLLFIENVGNLVCPAAFNLGENFKIALLSVTEGEDKPLKYPSLFTKAPVAVITKTDLLPHLECDVNKLRNNLRQVHPGVSIIELSAKSDSGMDDWFSYLLNLVE